MLNNKGQSLVLFVVVLPILLLVIVLVVDIGRIIIYKQELDSISNIVLDYGLDNLNKNDLSEEIFNEELLNEDNLTEDDLKKELVNIVKLNNNDIDKINIEIIDNKIYLELNDSLEGLFTGIINVSIFDVNSSYVGYIENEEKKIERMVGD